MTRQKAAQKLWDAIMEGLEYCKHCQTWVEPEGKLDARGIYDTCPDCGEEV